jgi:hypothetical protein
MVGKKKKNVVPQLPAALPSPQLSDAEKAQNASLLQRMQEMQALQTRAQDDMRQQQAVENERSASLLSTLQQQLKMQEEKSSADALKAEAATSRVEEQERMTRNVAEAEAAKAEDALRKNRSTAYGALRRTYSLSRGSGTRY